LMMYSLCLSNSSKQKWLKRHPMLTHIAHETEVCFNPPIHSFTGDRRNL